MQNVSLLIALALLVAFIGSQNSNFFYSSNLATIGTTVAIVGILSVVQTVVMLLGGLDISVSSQAGLTSVAVSHGVYGHAKRGRRHRDGFAAGCSHRNLNGVILRLWSRQRGHSHPGDAGRVPRARNLISNGRAQGYTGVDHVFVFLAVERLPVYLC